MPKPVAPWDSFISATIPAKTAAEASVPPPMGAVCCVPLMVTTAM